MKPVVADLTVKRVIPAFAVNGVVSSSAIERITILTEPSCIVPCTTINGIGTAQLGATDIVNNVVAITTINEVIPCPVINGVVARPAVNSVIAALCNNRVIADPAVQRVTISVGANHGVKLR